MLYQSVSNDYQHTFFCGEIRKKYVDIPIIWSYGQNIKTRHQKTTANLQCSLKWSFVVCEIPVSNRTWYDQSMSQSCAIS